MGSDLKSFADCLKPFLFQSTLPGWGATEHVGNHALPWQISIHAPRMGSDQHHRRANITGVISIHAPRMGSDVGGFGGVVAGLHFNPRSPDGERQCR